MTSREEQHEALAIAFVTGQSTPEDLRAHYALFEKDAAYRARVSELEIWLAPLNEDVEDKMPPQGLLDDIMKSIEAETKDQNEVLPIAANSNMPNYWKVWAIASSFVAMAAIGSHFISDSQPSTLQDETPALMALLSDESQPQLAAIVYNPQTNKVVARFSNVTIPSEKDLELWLIRENGSGPVSLGVVADVNENNQVEFEIPLELQSHTDLLAISLEPLGGSGTQTGPQGPILFTGSVSQL